MKRFIIIPDSDLIEDHLLQFIYRVEMNDHCRYDCICRKTHVHDSLEFTFFDADFKIRYVHGISLKAIKEIEGNHDKTINTITRMLKEVNKRIGLCVEYHVNNYTEIQ